MGACALSALTTPSILSADRESESGWNQVLSDISDAPGARPFGRAHLIHAEAVRRSRASRIPHSAANGIRWNRSSITIGSIIDDSRAPINSFLVKLSRDCLRSEIGRAHV